jgi:hypothetical protein
LKWVLEQRIELVLMIDPSKPWQNGTIETSMENFEMNARQQNGL